MPQAWETYTAKMLEDSRMNAWRICRRYYRDEECGKYMHTTRFWSDEANDFEGWKVTPIDKKVKDYIEAQIRISNKADAAATSGVRN